ncbi:phosphate ABC transporter permease PstA [Asticcacaulis taihuensis]|uniref:phosphate ABC transporter permease PstA n=1 Tax=Asticcacaulis taihuensis TaxID=260084 RepID=UPI0026F309B9|nr:phosphate ABC transporter permease PstA [Asticcacaulis taihuensis]
MDRALRRKLANYVFIGLCVIGTAIALGALALILWSLFTQGIGGMNLKIFTMDTPAAGSEGGLRNAIVGSILMCGVGMIIAVVVGILAGTWLAEIGGDTTYGHVVRFLNDVLLSAPSILIGLFVYELLVFKSNPLSLGHFSGWAGAISLAILATPIVTRTTEDILNLQPNALREAGMALGASQFTTIRSIIWKAAGSGLLTGGLLGFARISGETAPLLFTALGNQFYNGNLSQPMASLPVTMFNFALTPYEDLNKLAWAGALLVAVAVLGVNILGRWLAREKNAGH